MKKRALMAIASLLALIGCGGEEIATPSVSNTLLPVRFHIGLEQEEVPFPATKAMPSNDIPDPSAAGQPPTEVTEGELYNRIDYIVYGEENPEQPFRHRTFTRSDPDFSIIYDSLPPGNYQICFLAHSDAGLTVSGQEADFSRVMDTFHRLHSIEIAAGEEVTQDITLERIVSKVEFVSRDAVPDDLAHFTINVDQYQHRIDLTTGAGVSSGETHATHYAFQAADAGKAGFTHAFFTFVALDETPLSARLTAVDQAGETTRERTVADIRPIRNRIIRYTGILYTPRVSDDTFTLSIMNDGSWDSTIDKELSEEE